MTLPVVPGNSMSFSQINTELGLSSTTTISLNQASVRTLAGVGASPATIAITNLSGKSNEFTFTISTNQSDANLATLATAAGWNGTSKLVATINSGVQITSTSTGTPALTISGSFPGTVRLNNAGTIVGRGGTGGAGTGFGSVTGGNGGVGLAVSVAVTINNTGTIGGGGGGGGGGPNAYGSGSSSGGGGGAGFGPRGTNGSFGTQSTAGGLLTGGSGGAYGAQRGGAGGSAGASGGVGYFQDAKSYYTAGNGGSGGNCITGNSNITYIATGTRLGTVS
jgi:hypothetical protein